MNGRILIIDDEREVCETLHAALTKKGFTIVWRTSGQEGFELRVLEAVGGNNMLAARVLWLDRATLYRKLARYEAGL